MSFDDAFETFPQLETERLILREITANDVEQIFRLFNNLEKSYLFVTPRFYKIEAAKRFIEHSHELHSQKWVIDWWFTLKENDTIIGSVRLSRFERKSKAVIEYFIAKEYRGKGIITEAVNAVVKYAFEKMGLHRIEATDHPENRASSRVLEKAGFEKEGLLRKHEWRGEKWCDSVIWSIIRDDAKD